MSPIDWGAHNGELVEQVASVMLLQTRPEAWRRQPSSGDAGVDVANPIAGGYEVVQIKSFTGELTASRKKKIEKSLKQAKAGGELDAPIKQWRLLMPMDRSKEADVWWKALIKDAGFDCLWWGKTHMDKLAAEQPHVIDYYLRGGAARVEERFRDLLRTKDLIEFADTGPQPAEIRRPLLDLLEALNREDPNYRYSFEAGFEPNPPMLERARPGLVMSVTEHVPDRGYVTIRVTARHRYAGEERPVTISFQADPGGDAHAALTRAFRYGATADLPIGSVQNLKLDAPGGLSTNADTAGLRLTPLSDPTFTPFQMRLAVRDDLGDELGAVVLNAVDRRPGTHGAQLDLEEVGGTFAVTAEIGQRDGKPHVGFSQINMRFWGRRASQVADPLTLLNTFVAPNMLALSATDVDAGEATWYFKDTAPKVPADLVAYVRDLRDLQRHTIIPLNVPDTVTVGMARAAHRSAQLLRGIQLDGHWEKADLTMRACELEAVLDHLDTGAPFPATIPHQLDIGSGTVDLGQVLVRFATAKPADPDAARALVASGENLVTITIIPDGEGNTYEEVRYDGDAL